jgi:hypothetical protein
VGSVNLDTLNKNGLIDSSDNGGFLVGASSLAATNPKHPPSTKQSSNLNHVNSINHASSSLKSSVKRLFSPISNKNSVSNNVNTSHGINNQIASLPSAADANSTQPSSTPLMATKKHQNSMRQAPVVNQTMQNQSHAIKSLDKSLEASVFSTKSDHLSTSVSSATSNLSTSNMTTSNSSSLNVPAKSISQESNGKSTLKKKDNDMVYNV